MSIWKLRVGVENYYLGQVAEGLGDYYSGRGEMAGRWVGTAASGLGLGDDPVTASELRAVLAGLTPGTGLTPNGDQLRTFKGRVPGFDLTFAAPKSVSILYALGDALVVTHVVEAHDRAVDAAVAWLEREACFVRRGSNNRATANSASSEFGTRRLPGAGFVAAAFRHRTSRAGDPHLHTHVLVSNLTRGPDRKWSALDAQGLYRSKHAAGAVFRSVLEHELTERLGVGWRPGPAGIGEVAGIPAGVIRTFSKRRAEIEARMEADGTSGAAAAAEAMLATRTSKEDVDPETLRERWATEAADVGFDTASLDGLLADGVADPGDRLVVDGVDWAGQHLEFDDTAAAFAGRVADAMVAVDSTCTRHQILGIIADLLPRGVSAPRLEQLTAWVLAQPELLPITGSVASDAGTGEAGWEQRWTSRRLIAIEQAMIDMYTAETVAAAVDSGVVEAHIKAAGLGPDQAAAVAHVSMSGRAVDVIVGRAGTGKTYTMNTVRTIFESAGYRVVGVAPSARAARELGDGAGIDAYTFPRFALHAEPQLTDRHVVIVDEAGMAGTLDLHHVLGAARAVRATVILVGDHHQLPEISAGGGLAAAIGHVPVGVVELTVNRRQVAEWEHTALDHLRHGQVLDGYHLYADHGHVTVADTVDAVHAAAVDDWHTAYRAGCDAILLAGTRSEARSLNQQARARLADTLTGPALTIGRNEFLVGDRVVLLRNDAGHLDLDTGRTCRVDNGMLATINRIHHDCDDVDVTLVNGRRIRIRHDYVTAGHLEYGYATTIHKAQGVTCDRVFVVGPAGLYREAVYVAMSRARDGAWLYATSRQAADLDTPTHRHGRGIALPSEHADEPDYDLRQALQASRAKQFAISHDRHLQAVADLADSTPLDVLWERHIHLRRTTGTLIAAGHTDPCDMTARLEKATVHRRFMTVGSRVNAADWDNLGTIVAIFDTTGTALATFTSSDGQRSATRTIEWADLRPVDHPDEQALTPQANEWLQLAEQAVTETVTEWNSLLAAHGISPDEAHVVPAAIEMRRQRATHTLIAANPDWLTWWYGTRPDDPAGAQVWDDAIARVAAWRDSRHHAIETPGYGPAPDNPDEHRRWVDHLDHSLTTRTWLQHHHPALTPSTPTFVDIAAVREHLAELTAIIATAPADQTRVIDAITTAHLAAADIHPALVDAAHTQTARSEWILEHWPHIVEHAELTAISNNHPALAHWPAPVNPAIEDLYQRLLTASHDTPDTEPLTDLDRQLDDADPERRMATIAAKTAELAALRQQIAHAHTQGDAIQQDVLDSHLTRIDARIAELADEHRIQRSMLILWNLGSRPDGLADVIDNRINHLTHHALTTRPAWVDNLITQWHTNLRDNRPDDLHDLIGRIAAWRERTGYTGDDPLGSPPVDATQLALWHELDNMTISRPVEREMQISDLLEL